MAAGRVPVPHIIPLVDSATALRNHITCDTPIQISCGRDDVDIYYTTDGRLPQPYAPIGHQHSTQKLGDGETILLPRGKQTIKAVAIARKGGAESKLVTRTFYVDLDTADAQMNNDSRDELSKRDAWSRYRHVMRTSSAMRARNSPRGSTFGGSIMSLNTSVASTAYRRPKTTGSLRRNTVQPLICFRCCAPRPPAGAKASKFCAECGAKFEISNNSTNHRRVGSAVSGANRSTTMRQRPQSSTSVASAPILSHNIGSRLRQPPIEESPENSNFNDGMKCVYCRTKNEPGAAFCGACGKKCQNASPPACPQCNTAITNAELKFCTICGALLTTQLPLASTAAVDKSVGSPTLF